MWHLSDYPGYSELGEGPEPRIFVREGFKTKIKKWLYLSIRAGWGQQGAKIQPKKILFPTKNTKMIRMV